MRVILISLLSFILYSCNSSDCTNGIQDGNETGVDCGGNCPTCTTPTAPQNNISGDWDFGNSRIIKVYPDNTEVDEGQGAWGFQTQTHRFQSGVFSVFFPSIPATINQVGTYNTQAITINSTTYDILSVNANQLIFQRFIGYIGATQTTQYERTTLNR